MLFIRNLFYCLASTLYFCTSVYAQETISSGDISYNQYTFTLPADIEKMTRVDINHDGYQDLLAFHLEGLFIFLQDNNGHFDFENPSASINLTGASMGWDLVEIKAPGATLAKPALLALMDGKTIVTWNFTGNTISAPVTLLSGLDGFPPKGFFNLHFARDINNDERIDFVIPEAGQLALYLQQPSGEFQEKIQIQSTTYLQTSLQSSSQLEQRLGQRLYIPLMELRDVNSDGHNDLVSWSEERLDVFILKTDNGIQSYPQEPNYTLNISEIKQRLGEFSIDQLDFSNLTGVLALTHQVMMHDVDNDGIDDLLVREGGKISLFAGINDGMDFSQPRQVLRSSGNVLAAFARDENDDGLDDLWLLRIENISIGDIFLWLALSSSIEVEAFIYHNEGAQFARRPARKLTLDIEFPSVLRLVSIGTGIVEEVETSEELITPTAFANINHNSYDELLVLLNDRVDIYLDTRDHEQSTLPSEEEIIEEVERSILTFFDYQADKDNYQIDIKDLIDKLVINKNEHLALVANTQPALQVVLPEPTESGDIFPLKLNQDDVDDIVVFLERGEDYITGVLLLSNEADDPNL